MIKEITDATCEGGLGHLRAPFTLCQVLEPQPTVCLCSCWSFCLEGLPNHWPPLANSYSSFIKPTYQAWMKRDTTMVPSQWLDPSLEVGFLPHLSHKGQPCIHSSLGYFLDVRMLGAAWRLSALRTGTMSGHASRTLYGARHIVGAQWMADGFGKWPAGPAGHGKERGLAPLRSACVKGHKPTTVGAFQGTTTSSGFFLCGVNLEGELELQRYLVSKGVWSQCY